ncbi:hypothetical protein NDU88_006078 [Pleurodeles waltl]|uniref:Uncharacterized protein n=1 Tax=Pleurodeles waltl TaxID=8319 RepID=A0AAV7PQE0_PLEWA|nr:hypothetical protein NDU88_006078 [Pleurodeles waltl]
MVKTPRASRGKPSLEMNMGRRDQKHPVGPSKNRANVQRKVQQSGSLMDKLQYSVNYVPTADMGPQIPEMFKQPLRMKCTPPQALGNDGTKGAWSSMHNGDADGCTRTAAGTEHSQNGAGMHITTMETHTDVLETEVKAAIKQSAVQELQISDVQWKLEDAENR